MRIGARAETSSVHHPRVSRRETYGGHAPILHSPYTLGAVFREHNRANRASISRIVPVASVFRTEPPIFGEYPRGLLPKKGRFD
jgi:hypothetical protein